MKKWIVFVVLALIILSFVVPTPAYTRGGWGGGWRGGWGGGWRGGWGWWGPGAFLGGAAFGAALAYPYYAYPYPYGGYPYPYAYSQPPQPQVYAEPQQEYWYYCKDPQGYYPYVANCPGGWMRVAPTPPPPQGKEEGPVR